MGAQRLPQRMVRATAGRGGRRKRGGRLWRWRLGRPTGGVQRPRRGPNRAPTVQTPCPLGRSQTRARALYTSTCPSHPRLCFPSPAQPPAAGKTRSSLTSPPPPTRSAPNGSAARPSPTCAAAPAVGRTRRRAAARRRGGRADAGSLRPTRPRCLPAAHPPTAAPPPKKAHSGCRPPRGRPPAAWPPQPGWRLRLRASRRRRGPNGAWSDG